ncbi:peptide chain release factor N(5)-glutamine methyltransferase [Sphingomonas sp. LaA6.9]|uniref:peptide chain release factor N(5)-glutamine methyltransferase n=1 Tax=Sphingomonas sp. LaA6.9 TaxID=2919914 RepID=UPI001F4F7009|nr:peptide chain release factor N(5)-glutamine methyltransferase [Sphingomonas sp. LaA6.9]MCJ8158341.1 peptide chain release factor N(5)-glutamine methyltransferase [Sphingomonas sp. LaA6.9]
MDKALREAARRLGGASDTPRLDAELLMAHALGVRREDVLLGRAGSAVPEEFAALLERRLSGEPLAYITGTRDFWTITLHVAPGVLIPRPDSETLIEAALAHFGATGPKTVLDLGTGPGTLLLAALDQWPEATGLGIDASGTALDIARANAARLGLGARAAFASGDWAAGLSGPYDLVLCNPPYIAENEQIGADVRAFEPHEALFAGSDGLSDYRKLAIQIPPLIAQGGLAAIEIGATQRTDVEALFADSGCAISCRSDLAGRDRAIVLSRA